MKKALTMAAVLLLVLALGIGGTLAYLTSKSETITNTFTVGNVSISLTEHQYDENNFAQVKKDTDGTPVSVTDNEQSYKLIPGTTYAKDPTVTVEKDSEDCYLFVKLEKLHNPDTYLEYTNKLTDGTSGWTALEGVTDVYYREVTRDADNDQTFALIKDNQVTVKSTLDNNDLKSITENTQPQLKYTAYAIQESGFNSASVAWTALQKQINPSTSGT